MYENVAVRLLDSDFNICNSLDDKGNRVDRDICISRYSESIAEHHAAFISIEVVEAVLHEDADPDYYRDRVRNIVLDSIRWLDNIYGADRASRVKDVLSEF